MRAHIIENNIVVNTIVVESLDIIPGLVDAAAGGQIGDIYNPQAGTFTTPAPVAPVPDSVTPRQFRLGLKAIGLLAAVQAHIATLAADDDLRIDWEYASEFKRDYPSVAAMATLLGKTEEDIDNLFRLCGQIS